MLSGETADCLALANTAILMRLMEELAERNVMPRPSGEKHPDKGIERS